MLGGVLARCLAYAAIGWLAAFVVKSIRFGMSLGNARDALFYALIWGIGGAFLGAVRRPPRQ